MEDEVAYNNDDNIMLQTQPTYTHHHEPAGTPEIEEVSGEEEGGEHGGSSGGPAAVRDVYVAVGKDDVEVLRWALEHAVLPGGRVNLIHVFPPLSTVSTPVGRLWVSQLGPEQVKVYANEENTKRKSMLHKYIRLCIDTKVEVDTILIESTETTKAILDLIPVLNMTSLVMGIKHTSRRLMRGVGKGTQVQRSAPDYCKVTLVNLGKKSLENKTMTPTSTAPILSIFSTSKRHEITRAKYDKDFTQCRCFPVRF